MEEELWIEFVNSEWHDWRGSGASEDRLLMPGWLGDWLARRGLPLVGQPAAEPLAALLTFRDELRSWAERLAAGNSLVDADFARLNERLTLAPFTKRLQRKESGELRISETAAYDGDGVNGLLTEIAHSFARTVSEQAGSRVRICDNRDCLWVFYDDTRNRSKRYCDDSMCGNLMKVRRFRERKKSAVSGANSGASARAERVKECD